MLSRCWWCCCCSGEGEIDGGGSKVGDPSSVGDEESRPGGGERGRTDKTVASFIPALSSLTCRACFRLPFFDSRPIRTAVCRPLTKTAQQFHRKTQKERREESKVELFPLSFQEFKGGVNGEGVRESLSALAQVSNEPSPNLRVSRVIPMGKPVEEYPAGRISEG